MIARRVGVALGLFCLLAGPTQGAVGSCSDSEDPLAGRADVLAYCEERDQLVCVRRFERGEISLGQQEDCRRVALVACQSRMFLPGCTPTERQAEACLGALHSRTTLHLKADQIAECRAVCPLPVDSAPSDSSELKDGGSP